MLFTSCGASRRQYFWSTNGCYQFPHFSFRWSCVFYNPSTIYYNLSQFSFFHKLIRLLLVVSLLFVTGILSSSLILIIIKLTFNMFLNGFCSLLISGLTYPINIHIQFYSFITLSVSALFRQSLCVCVYEFAFASKCFN